MSGRREGDHENHGPTHLATGEIAIHQHEQEGRDGVDEARAIASGALFGHSRAVLRMAKFDRLTGDIPTTIKRDRPVHPTQRHSATAASANLGQQVSEERALRSPLRARAPALH